MRKSSQLITGFLAGISILALVTYQVNKKELCQTLNLSQEQHNDSYDQRIKDYHSKPKRAYDRPDLAFEHNFQMTKDIELNRPTPEVIPGIIKELGPVPVSLGRSAGSDNQWTNLGPNNVGGRTRAICIDANDPTDNTVFAGSVSGGLWKTTNFLADNCSWAPVSSIPAGISITGIKQDPSNPNVMYICTGEEAFAAVGSPYGINSTGGGMGLWKSVNSGQSWNQVNSIPATTAFADIDIDQRGRVLLANPEGLWVSEDQGASFFNAFDRISGLSVQSRYVMDIEVAADGRILLGCGRIFDNLIGGIVLLDLNVGNVTSLPLNQSGRIEIATAPSDPNRSYALVQQDQGSGLQFLLRTTDGGQNWLSLPIPTDFVSAYRGGIDDFTRGQAWYDLIAKVSPIDPNVLIVGGIDLFMSKDGGNSWGSDWCRSLIPNQSIASSVVGCPMSLWTAQNSNLSQYYAHADHHVIEFLPSNPNAAIFGNDGGVQLSTNLNQDRPTFVEKNNNYIVAQYYACAPHSQDDIFIAGAQDNGTHEFRGTSISDESEVTGGDGGFCFIDPDGTQITAYTNNSFTIIQAGSKNREINIPANGSYTDGHFINPASYDPTNRTLYSVHVVRADNPPHWGYHAIPIDQGDNGITTNDIDSRRYGMPSCIQASPHNTRGQHTIFIGTEGGQNSPSYLIRVNNARSGSPVYTELGAFPGGWISSIAIGETDNDILITFSNYGAQKIWLTRNGGQSWTNIDGNIPNVPIRSALFSPYNPDRCLISTELGIWKCYDLAANQIEWIEKNETLGRVRVDMLRRRPSDNLVVAASHGRGLWISRLFEEDNILVEVEPNPIILPDLAGTMDFSVKANTSWTLSEEEDWFSLSIHEGDSNATVQIEYETNSSLFKREGVITVSGPEFTSFEVPVIQDETSEPTLYVEVPNMIVSSDGGNYDNFIVSNRNWRINADSLPDWIRSISPSQGASSQIRTQIRVNVLDNTGPSNRFHIFNIRADDISAELVISQPKDSLGYLDITPKEVSNVRSNGESLAFSIFSDLNWTLSSSESWLTASLSNGSGDQSMTLTIEPNTEAFDRFGHLTITATNWQGETIERIVEIQQNGNGAGTDSSSVAIRLFPNIIQDNLTIYIQSDQAIPQAELILIHVQSQQRYPIHQPSPALLAGQTRVPIRLDGSHPPGMYILILKTDKEIISKKLIITK